MKWSSLPGSASDGIGVRITWSGREPRLVHVSLLCGLRVNRREEAARRAASFYPSPVTGRRNLPPPKQTRRDQPAPERLSEPTHVGSGQSVAPTAHH